MFCHPIQGQTYLSNSLTIVSKIRQRNINFGVTDLITQIKNQVTNISE